MNKSNFLYNNEAIATLCIGYLISNLKIISISKVLLVLPFILNNQTVTKLRNKSYKRSLEEFIIKYPEIVTSFSSRYMDFLPLSINSISILNEIGIIRIERNYIHFNNDIEFNPLAEESLGNRSDNMFKAIDCLCEIMRQSDVNAFYLNLKIEL